MTGARPAWQVDFNGHTVVRPKPINGCGRAKKTDGRNSAGCREMDQTRVPTHSNTARLDGFKGGIETILIDDLSMVAHPQRNLLQR